MLLRFAVAIIFAFSVTPVGEAYASKCNGRDKISENRSRQLPDGKYISQVLQCNRGCYEVTVDSNQANIRGVANNCSDNMNGNWVVAGCGINTTISGSPDAAINKIIEQCSGSSQSNAVTIKNNAMVCKATKKSAESMKEAMKEANERQNRYIRNMMTVGAEYAGPNDDCFQTNRGKVQTQLIQKYDGNMPYLKVKDKDNKEFFVFADETE